MSKLKIEDLLEDMKAATDVSTEIIPVMTEGDDRYEWKDEDGEDIPVLALRNMVMFPGVIIPVTLGRQQSLNAVKLAYKTKKMVGIFAQKEATIEQPEQDDLYNVGVLANVIKILEMPDDTQTAILQGKTRIELKSLDNKGKYMHGNVGYLPEVKPDKDDAEFKALTISIKEKATKIIKGEMSQMPKEAVFALNNMSNERSLINFVSANIGLNLKEKQDLLETNDFKERGFKLLKLQESQLQILSLKREIQYKTQSNLEKQQRQYYLQQAIHTIQDEMGDNAGDATADVEKLREKAKKKVWSKEIQETFDKEIEKLQRLSPHTPEYGVQENYLENIVDLPWGKYSKDSHDLVKAQTRLDHDHYGLEKVKERIIEHLAVLALKNDMKSPILCLYGPPGVGKTSLGKSIASSLNRKYVRVSLGGLHDEAEIRGHRRTYIGAMPGRIIDGIKKAGTSNPVFILDEIDKVGNDYKGDPESALLEVLDPEQNKNFHDNFLDVDYDLSKVMFIATANDISKVSEPLRDRMELIEVNGYIEEEKEQIALKHLIPKNLEETGLKGKKIKFDKDALQFIIEKYTAESGVRGLEKQINHVFRKIATKVVEGKDFNNVVTKDDVKEYLGSEKYLHEKYEGNDYAGVVTGLAWTSVGGEILFIETSLNKSKGSKLNLTGNLGNVMKESAQIAYEFLKAHAEPLGITEEQIEDNEVNMHVPEGATPKDGPSAGITILTSMTSAFTQKKVRKNLAMTGELTLRGKVTPVGGIKEKILAAKRAGIKEIILCEENKRDIDEIDPKYLQGLEFHFYNDAIDVLNYALLDEKAHK